MKKICLVIPDLNKGGMERVMSELAFYFVSKEDTKVTLILLINQSNIFYKFPANIPIYKPSFKFSNNYRTVSTIRTLLFLRRTIKKISPDAVLSFGETYNSFVLMSCIGLKVNVFVSDRSKPDKRWGIFQENLRKILYPMARGIISQTSYSKEFLMKETKHKNIMVIPNPVRVIENKSLDKSNIIINVGRIIKSKRIDLLLQIFCKCENEGWELWIVGNDERNEKNALVELSDKLGIKRKVKFWDKQEDIDKFYTKAKIFAFSSESEGLPNVLLEAMSAGLACISFDCIAGPSDVIVDGENGFLVKLYNIEEYVVKLNSLIKEPDLRDKLSKNAQRISEDLSIDIIGEKYYNFLLL